MLSTEEQQETLQRSSALHGVGIGQDDESLDLTDSRLYRIYHQDMIGYPCSFWNKMDNATREAWKMQATRLNSLPVPGLLLEMSQELDNTLFLRSVNVEW